MEPLISELEQKLGIKFKNPDLLKEALTHRSFLNEHKDWLTPHNERLELLGDSVLSLVVTVFLLQKFPDYEEGKLTAMRASLINSNALLEVAQELDLKKYLYVSKGESKGLNLHSRSYALSDAVEALIGAIYLDQGFEGAQKFIEQYILTKLESNTPSATYKDAKSLFQEKSQEIYGITPVYRLLESWGPDHAKQFRCGVYLADELVASGEGPSKQLAEVAAASNALIAKGWQEESSLN
ncbi:MAG: Ribonuclease 3 [Parcubacteria group bacterium ADurb.Bin305]|jgi:ribonuclease-3|nr:ribonuclease III [Candidatus Paceibacterota bacterium]MDD3434717.1 ribonuclease III [Candidatus Paceibacterota bacterium]OQA43780.1 MAG: Ribonuclease 3 [Parcubacteria group bacterium ADurb.Bin305]